MFSVLLKAFSLIFIILLAFLLKQLGLFARKDYAVIVKVVLNVTLPASVIVSFSSTTLDRSMLLLTGFGILCNCAMLLLGMGLGRKQRKGLAALYCLGTPGYNIGAFAMPFAQGFLGAQGIAAVCLFDTGNAIMCTGGSFAATDLLLNGSRENPIRAIAKRLASSTPFLTYTVMLLFSLVGIRIPGVVADFLRPIANANPFCAMFMVGLMFELNFDGEILKSLGKIVLIRNLFAVLLALGFYFLTPFALPVRQALALVVFAPPSALTPAFTERCGGDAATASVLTSLCTLTALLGMTAVLLLTA